MTTEYVDLMKQNDSNALKHYIKHIVILLQYLRIWPMDDSTAMYKSFSVTGLVALLLVGNLFLIIAELIAAVKDFSIEQMVNIICTLGMHMSGFWKWIFCIVKGKEITILMNGLNRCHLLCARNNTSEKDKQKYKYEMERAREMSNLFTYGWTSVCVYGVIHWSFNPIIIKLLRNAFSATANATGNMLPFIGWYPWETESPRGYLITYIVQVIGNMGSIFGIVSYDVFYISLLILICGQLRYLNIVLINVDACIGVHEAKLNLNEKLKNCVAIHTEVTKLLDELQALVSPIMFVQCVETLAVICTLSVQFAGLSLSDMNFEHVMLVWSMVEYFCAAATQLFYFCFYATEIKTLSLQIADSIYLSGWEDAQNADCERLRVDGRLQSENIKCLVGMMMVRSQKPVILKGGPFYELSLETFKSIIGMAMSNSVILRQASEY